MEQHLCIAVADPSDAGEARRVASGLTAGLGFDATDAGRSALVVTEAATNIVKHAGKGEILLRIVREVADRPGIEVLALDRGPGMADVSRCMQDGYSTAGSPGTGLGAIGRLSNLLDIYSVAGSGTALLARVLPKGAKMLVDPGPLTVGAVRLAAPNETECGDDWSLQQAGRRAVLLLADGLGHGVAAAKASAEAVRILATHSHLPVDAILQAAHGALLATRGAAGSVAEVHLDTAEVRFAGIGNVAGFLAWPGGSRSMVTQNGTLGGTFPRTLRVFSYSWPPGASLIMYTDGLKTHVSMQPYPGLLARHPTLVAAVLYRDFRRGHDDVTVLVAREI